MTSQSSSSRTKHPQTLVACDSCRRSKTKCSGTRPVCRKCADRKIQCYYSADEDARPFIALRRKYSALSEAYDAQARQLAILRPQQDVNPAADSPNAHRTAIHHVPTQSVLDGGRMSMPARSLSDSVLSTSSRQDVIENTSDHASRILNAMTLTSDEESLILLARLRMGETWSTIVEDISSRQSTVARAIQLEDAHEMDSASSQPSILSAVHVDVLYARTHGIDPGEETTNLLRDQQNTPFARTTALIVAKPWLTEIFDRQYFRQVGYIYHTPRADPSPETLDTQTSFGNMPFSSAIAANYHPAHVQEIQQHNFLVPIWARRVLNGATIHADPFQNIMTELLGEIANGVAVEDLCGSHPYIEALDDADAFHRAPKLSKIAARTIASIKTPENSTTFTHYAMMYWFWALWRWLLSPTKEAYSAIPEFAKPTTSQLFVSHPPIFDFVMPPGLRDIVCQDDTPNIQWFTEAAITIECHWDGSASSALCRDGFTNEIDFNPICKSHIASLENWTLGRSVRTFLPDIESFTKLK